MKYSVAVPDISDDDLLKDRKISNYILDALMDNVSEEANNGGHTTSIIVEGNLQPSTTGLLTDMLINILNYKVSIEDVSIGKRISLTWKNLQSTDQPEEDDGIEDEEYDGYDEEESIS